MNHDITVISLKNSDERRQSILDQMRDLDIDFKFFDAIDPKNLSSSEIAKLKLKHQPRQNLTNGQFGVALSHYYAIEEWLNNSDRPWLIVFEDDVKLSPRFKDISALLDGISATPTNILRLGGRKSRKSRFAIRVGQYAGFDVVFPLKSSACCVAYAVRRTGARQFLDHMQIFSRPIDWRMFHDICRTIVVCEIHPFAFSETGAETTIDHHNTTPTLKTHVWFPWMRDIKILGHYFLHFKKFGTVLNLSRTLS